LTQNPLTVAEWRYRDKVPITLSTEGSIRKRFSEPEKFKKYCRSLRSYFWQVRFEETSPSGPWYRGQQCVLAKYDTNAGMRPFSHHFLIFSRQPSSVDFPINGGFLLAL
jgi:hypothetical protein